MNTDLSAWQIQIEESFDPLCGDGSLQFSCYQKKGSEVLNEKKKQRRVYQENKTCPRWLKNSFDISKYMARKPSLNVMGMKSFYKNLGKVVSVEERLSKKFRKDKQNISISFSKKEDEMKGKIMEAKRSPKCTIVNVFERIQIKQPRNFRYTDNDRRKKMQTLSKAQFGKLQKTQSKYSQHVYSTIKSIIKSSTTPKSMIDHNKALEQLQENKVVYIRFPFVKKWQKSTSEYKQYSKEKTDQRRV